MGLFDFFKKKPVEETPVEEQREGVVEIDGVEVETDVETEMDADALIDVAIETTLENVNVVNSQDFILAIRKTLEAML